MLSRRGAVTGIDVGHQAIKLVRLENGGPEPLRLTHWGVEELPSLAEISINDQVDALKRLLHRLSLRPKFLGQVATAVGGQDVHLRQVSMPRLAPVDLQKALPYEARKHLPLDGMTQPYIDCQILDGIAPDRNEDGEETQEVLLVATSRQQRDDILETLLSVGIDPDVLDAQPLPAVNAILEAHPAEEQGWVVVLDVGASSTTLTAVLPDGHFYSRPLVFTGRSLTEHIGERLGMENPDAEIFKREMSEYGSEEGRELIHEHVHGLVSGVIETVRFLGVRKRQCPVSRIYLCGGGTLLGGLRDQLTAALQVPVEYPDPFRELPKSARNSGPSVKEIPWLVGALGLARWWD